MIDVDLHYYAGAWRAGIFLEEDNMNRFTSWGAWFCTHLGIALMIIGALITPEDAFGDPGEECYEQAHSVCSFDPDYQSCMEKNIELCCSGKCGSDEECYDTCYEEAFKGICLGDFACNFGCKYNGYSKCVDPELCRTAVGCKGCSCYLQGLSECICKK